MNIKIEGSGIYLKITVERDGSVDERMLRLVSGQLKEVK